MNPADRMAETKSRLPGWDAMQRALLPDYNAKATAYWWCVVGSGCGVLLYSLAVLTPKSPLAWTQTIVGTLIAMLAGFFPVRIPRSKNSFAAGEIFIFLLLLIQGPEAAVVAAVGEAAVGSWRTSNRWSSRIVSPMMAALAMFGSGSLLNLAVGGSVHNASVTIVAAMAFAQAYFVLNTLLVTTVPRLKRNEPLQLSDLFGVFGWDEVLKDIVPHFMATEVV